MRLLLRHILKSILRAPLQTLILIVTIAFSATIFTCVSDVSFAISQEISISHKASYGEADLAIHPISGNGYVAENSLKKHSSLGEFSGYFSLPVYDENGSIMGAGADFYKINEFFDFDLVEVKELKKDELNGSVFISKQLADERNLRVGSQLKLSVLDQEKTYLVSGINSFRFFGSYDVLLNAEEAIGKLSSVSPVFSVFSKDNLPLSTVCVKLNEGVNLGAAIERLNSSLNEYGYVAEKVETTEVDYWIFLTNLLVYVLLAFSCVAAFILVGFSVGIISKKRREEMRAFALCGASQKSIFISFCAEIFLCLIIGVCLGLTTAYFILNNLLSVNFEFFKLTLSFRGIITAVLCELLMTVILLFRFKKESSSLEVKKPKSLAKLWLIAFIFGIGLLAISFFLKPSARLYTAIVCSVLIVLAVVFGVPALIKLLAKLIVRLSSKLNEKIRPTLWLSAKNTLETGELQNVYRILATVFSLIMVMNVSVAFSQSQIDGFCDFFKADYVVYGAGSDAQAAVENLKGTKQVEYAFFIKGYFKDGKNAMLADCSNAEFLSDYPQVYPTGNGIILNKSICSLYGVSIGDDIEITFNTNQKMTFVLQGYTDNPVGIGYINSAAVGLKKDVLLLRGEGADYLKTLTKTLQPFGAVVQEKTALLRTQIHLASSFNNVIRVYGILIFTITLTGSLNLAWVCYMRRRQHFKALRTVGVTKKELTLTVIFEWVGIIIAVSTIAFVCGDLLTLCLDGALNAFGQTLF